MIKMTTTLSGVANVEARITRWREKFPKAVRAQTLRQAHRLRTLIVKGIRSGAPGGQEFQKLAESTVEMKGSSKPLIDNGDLLRSIGVEEIGGDAFFVGTSRNATGKDGESLVNIAEIHEYGTKTYFIPVTPAMRRFWWAMVYKGVFDRPLSPRTEVIHHPGIPARPYLRPSYDEWEKDAERQFEEGLANTIGLGRV